MTFPYMWMTPLPLDPVSTELCKVHLQFSLKGRLENCSLHDCVANSINLILCCDLHATVCLRVFNFSIWKFSAQLRVAAKSRASHLPKRAPKEQRFFLRFAFCMLRIVSFHLMKQLQLVLLFHVLACRQTGFCSAPQCSQQIAQWIAGRHTAKASLPIVHDALNLPHPLSLAFGYLRRTFRGQPI